MALNDLAWDSNRPTREGNAAVISRSVFSPDTSTLSRAAVPQSHRTEKKIFLKPALAERFILNPGSGVTAMSADNASEMCA
jgi:hypothetical protein